MDRRGFLARLAQVAGGGAVLSTLGCDVREFARAHGAKLRLSVATGNTGGVFYPYGGGIAKIISAYVPNVEATAEVSGGSVDNLNFIFRSTADIGLTTADALDEAYRGTGPFAKVGRVPVRALAVLYDSYLHVVTMSGSGIDRIADMRGKVVSVGAAGSSTEGVALRVLDAVGLGDPGATRRQGLSVQGAVDAMKDGKLDAFFWVGGVPTGSVLDLASTPGRSMRLLSSEDVIPELQRKYGASLYRPLKIAKSAYPNMKADVVAVGLANVIVVDEKMSEPLAYDITRVLFDYREELIAIHDVAKELTLPTAPVGSPVPFHPGSIRYYREKGVWKEDVTGGEARG